MTKYLKFKVIISFIIVKPSLHRRFAASFSLNSDTLRAVNDQIDPPNSADLGVPRQTWWDHLGSKEWIQYDFTKAEKVSSVEVYWFDDRKTGKCRVPGSWVILARNGDNWEPVTGAGGYGVERDKFNIVKFDPVETTGLRLEVNLQKACSGGVLEWRVLK